MIVLVVGIPGSGKSSLLQMVNSLSPSIEILNYGNMMLQAGGNIDRDTLRKLPPERQQEIGLQACLLIAEKAIGKITFVDTHACIKTASGYIPGIPFRILNALNPKALVLIRTSPSLIIERRLKDSSRTRDPEGLEELTLHQELSLQYSVTASLLTGSTLTVIDNNGEDLMENIQPLLRLTEAFATI